MFDGQNVVICCEESERDPVHSASLEERKRSNSLRHVSLLSEINQQLKQEFGRFVMKRSRLSPRARDANLFLAAP